jgi:leader peptidase (prepilin peptidase)/N-methyltransferase
MGAEVAGACALSWLGALSVYDIREQRLPNWLTMPGAVTILAAAAAFGRGAPAVFGALGLAGLYLVVHLVAPAAMGAGDVKLAAGVGGLTGAFGYDVWVLAAIAAPLLTAMVACLVVVRRSGSGRTTRSRGTVPHGPSMCVATLVAAMLAIL